MCIYHSMYLFTYIYIYIERERETHIINIDTYRAVDPPCGAGLKG